MIFWIAAAALCALCVALLLRPLGRDAAVEKEAAQEIAVYRDQLAEVERDRAQGLLSAEEAHEARREIERRLLAADTAQTASETPGRMPPGKPVLALWLALSLAVPLIAMGLYLQLGSPETPSRPFAERADERRDAGEQASLETQLSARLAQDPEEPRAWEMLGELRLRLGDYAGAAEAYGEAIARGTPGAALYAARGEALTAAAGGRVTPEAKAAFDSALALAPGDPRARFYAGLAQEQAGRPREALETWRGLAAESPAETPWRAALESEYARVADSLGLKGAEARLPEGLSAPGPSREDVEAAEAMSPEERAAFIRSMVEGLETRLNQDPENPDNFDGWLRLARAYAVLGEIEKSRAALAQAETIAAALPPGDPRREAFEKAGEPETPPADPAQ
ncbi:MAG: c-type cytochrome biogenesis protein CcmI [Rhodovibrionaceae bacterium]